MQTRIDFVALPHLSAGFYQSLVLSNEENGSESKERKEKDKEKDKENKEKEKDQKEQKEKEKERNIETSKETSKLHSFGAHRNSLQCIQWPSLRDSSHAQPGAEIATGREENRFSAEPFVLEQFDGLNVVQVSCGGNHSAILEKRPGEEGGQVWIWGLGNGGRLGMKRPKKTSDVQEILKNSTCSADEVSALMSNKVYVQSLTSENNKKWSLHSPVKVKFGSRIASISCGTDYTLALTEDGSIYSWGLGSYGNLGTGLICDQHEPALVQMPDNVLCRQVAAGTKHSMALSTGGDMFSWGHGGHGRLGHGVCDAAMRPTKIVLNKVEGGAEFKFVAVGEAHSASIDSLGQVWCWGAGSFGRCGHGEETDFLVPQVVAGMIGKSCSQLALGVCHSLALTRLGRIWSWGGFLYTGHGEDDDIEAARELDDEELKGRCIVEIAAGRFHSLALASTGEVFSWGAGSLGRLGLGNSIEDDLKTRDQPTPMQIFVKGNALLGWQKKTSLATVEKRGFVGEHAELQVIACAGMHSAAVGKDGSCWLWGHGEYGQNASSQLEDFWKPTLLSAVDPISRMKIKVLSVALGMEHCLIISTNLELFSWGRNHRGQLGLGTTTDTNEPTIVAALAKASFVAAGEDHSAGITAGGEIYTWGNAECGKLGHGSSMIRSAMSFPKQINTETRVKKVSCGPVHTALIGSNGELLTFGAGWFGRLGHGDMDNQYAPKVVEQVLPDLISDPRTSPRFLEVTCGSFHTCAICEGSMLWVCGRDYLVCESDHITSPLLFNKIEESSEIVTVVAGANHTLCITGSGNLWGWGDNSKGQLGLGGGQEKALPTLISCKGWRARELKDTEETKDGNSSKAKKEIPQLMAVACGYAHSMAVTDSGEVWAWGLQSGGRLALKIPLEGKFCPIPQKVYPSWKLVEKQPSGR
eukprot:Skav217592  [mRNA]  locus=scaffold3512:89584:92656:- [translate_table: standard]